MDDILTALDEVLAARKQASAEDSYVASLNAAGLNKILEKVGEETTEVISWRQRTVSRRATLKR